MNENLIVYGVGYEGIGIMKKRWLYLAAFLLFLAVEVFIALFVHDRFVRPYIGDVLAGVEFLQYFNIVELLRLSDNAFMRVLIGSVFDGKDIICYGIGCAILQAAELFAGFRREDKPAPKEGI